MEFHRGCVERLPCNRDKQVVRRRWQNFARDVGNLPGGKSRHSPTRSYMLLNTALYMKNFFATELKLNNTKPCHLRHQRCSQIEARHFANASHRLSRTCSWPTHRMVGAIHLATDSVDKGPLPNSLKTSPFLDDNSYCTHV